MHSGFDLRADGVDRFAEIVSELNAQPVAGRLSEIGAEVEIGLGGDAALFIDDLVHPLVRQLRVLGEAVGRDAERGKKLFAEEFARVNVEVFLHGLMIVGDFYVLGVLAIPSKAHAVLVVDADAVLAGSISLQCFESIAWWESQFVESRGSLQLGEFAQGSP